MADLSSQSISIQSLYGLHSEQKLFVNRRYQRKLVWTLEEKQKLVESISKKYPIPAILLAERDAAPGTFEIIDGLQRLHAIVSFIEGAFPNLDGNRFDIKFFPTAKERSDSGRFELPSGGLITQRDVSAILDYTISLSVMRNATDREIDDVFDRINTYGHRLSDQERRQAGVQNDFAEFVRRLACTLRGDESSTVLPLESMPAISIDLPKTKHGYAVQADEVFWVNQGVLRSTDLRDSMDEQCIADIAVSIAQGEVIERSKDALDEIYDRDSAASKAALAALEVYGSERLSDEMKFCIDEIIKVCETGSPEKLRDIVSAKKNTNPFPNLFTVIAIAIYEKIIKEKKKIADYNGVKSALNNISNRIETTRKGTTVEERRKNIETVKGLISSSFVDGDQSTEIYENHSTIDIEGIIRRSEIELSNYELKQGLVSLSEKREIDEALIEKILQTACAIANNGPNRIGRILLGVTDKEEDAVRVKKLDKVDARKVGKRFVVGINREAAAIGKSIEEYYTIIRDRISKSPISGELKASLLSNIDFNSFYGLGVVVITVKDQKEMALYGDSVYNRVGDSTVLVTSAKAIGDIARRF